MQPCSPRSLAILALGILSTACAPKPNKVVLGKWDLVPATQSESFNQMQPVVEIRADGTWELTGNRVFEAVAGRRNVTGTYEFVEEAAIEVSMDEKTFDYDTTIFDLRIVTSKELILTTRDQADTITLKKK